MASHVIDLVSSSPSSTARAVTGSAPARHHPPTANLDNTRRWRPAADDTGHRTRAQEKTHDSADGDDDSDPFVVADPRRKSRRTSPPSPIVALPPLDASRPPPLVGRNAPLSRRFVDSIEVSSSMEQVSPKNSLPAASRQSPFGTLGCSVTHVAPVDSDPFASSPQPARYPDMDPGRHVRRAVSVDPFASSPSGVIGLPSNAATSQRPSSLTTGVSAAPARTLDFSRDHELVPAQRASEAVRKSFAVEIIDIDDSDSSDGSDGSDLPDIMDMDPATRLMKPRSPLKRSRSDTTGSKSRSKASAGRFGARSIVDRGARAAEKAAEKERKRREREQAKDARVKEKQRAAALAEANKLRTDKKVSTPEMIVDLPSSLASEHRVPLEVLLDGLGVEYTTWESPDQTIVRWRRKVTSQFDESLGRWEPILPRIQDEAHILAVLTAEGFVDLVLKDQVKTYACMIKEKYRRHDIIYLVQGMTPWMRKNRNLRNRQFASDVRANQAATIPGRGQHRGTSRAEYISEDDIEDALLRLQVEHNVFIHHTTIAAETAKWIATFTQHISTIPYKKQKDRTTSAAGFCMESGQVRTGEGPKDTYVKMLQEIFRITAPIAYGVAVEFDSVSKLVRGLEDGGPDRLDGVRKSANSDGQVSDRAIGQAVSRRLYRVFTGRDDGSTDV